MSDLPEISKGLVTRVAATLAGVNAQGFNALDADAKRQHRRTAKSILTAERKYLKKQAEKA